MNPVRVTASRTVGRMRSLYSSAIAVGAFLSASAVAFSFGLEAAEGGGLSVATVWAAAVSPFLPALAAFLAMDVFSDERQTGRIDMLLTAPVLERDLVLGKFLGVFVSLASFTLLSFALALAALRFAAPSALAGVGPLTFCPAFLALMLQGALWCAVSVAMSAVFRHAATAACASLALLVGIPRGGWAALLAWAPQGRPAFGEMPLDAQIVDMSSGLFSSGTIAFYLVLSVFFLFVASKYVALTRFGGRGGRSWRASMFAALALGFVLSGLCIEFAYRTDAKFDIPVGKSGQAFSQRMRNVLSEAHGDMTVTCFLSRHDARSREVGRFLRSLQSEGAAVGGLNIALRYVDPRWDVGHAEQLVRMGVDEGSLVFEKGRRREVVPLSDGLGERVCESAIIRLTMPPQRRNVYWTIGHGETSSTDYGAWGMSDIARDLARDGYRNATIDLSGDATIPSDCALIVVAGAKDDFSRAEAGRIDTYLRGGGRLLVLTSSADSGGISSLLPSWGLRAATFQSAGARTVTGSDVIAGEFAEHDISGPLKGSRIILERPVAFMPSAAAEAGAGADRMEFTPLAKSGTSALAAVVERGVGAGTDLSIRPTRIVAIGDATFAMNGQLAARASANRDFFLNCVAYLSGTDASVASGAGLGALVTGFDRAGRLRFLLVTAGAIPSVVALVMLLVAFRRRRRA